MRLLLCVALKLKNKWFFKKISTNLKLQWKQVFTSMARIHGLVRTWKVWNTNQTTPPFKPMVMWHLNGWSSRTTYMYACQGFIRISKTSFGGDLVSPKFASLSKPTDVKLSWQGIGYTSLIKLDEAGEYKSGGVHDHQYYYVAVLGAGEIEGAAKMNKVAYKDENMNDIEVNAALVKIPTDCFVTMDTLQAWTFEGTKNELTIKGATAETQVVFMSTIPNFTKTKTTDYSTAEMPLDENAPHGVNKKVNRVIFDNIKVVVADPSGVNDINVAKEVKVRKVIENGQVLIISGDKKYNLMGAEVK